MLTLAQQREHERICFPNRFLGSIDEPRFDLVPPRHISAVRLERQRAEIGIRHRTRPPAHGQQGDDHQASDHAHDDPTRRVHRHLPLGQREEGAQDSTDNVPLMTRGWGESVSRFARHEPMLLAFMAGAVIARVAFWLISNRMFEDGLTTITHARNVPLGLGLVHHAGEGNVHGFTSAIGVLIPLAGELVHQGSGMFAMRVASLIAVCIALVYARLICRDLRLGAFPTAFVLAYLAFDQNMIFYGMSGMETQVAVTVILGGVYHVRRQDLVASGIWLGLAPLARPEFVLWVAPALAFLALSNLRRAIAVAGIASALVAPWLMFTTAYYGSPIPNTVIAEATVSPIPALLSDGSPLPWLGWLFGQVTGH